MLQEMFVLMNVAFCSSLHVFLNDEASLVASSGEGLAGPPPQTLRSCLSSSWKVRESPCTCSASPCSVFRCGGRSSLPPTGSCRNPNHAAGTDVKAKPSSALSHFTSYPPPTSWSFSWNRRVRDATGGPRRSLGPATPLRVVFSPRQQQHD